MSLISINVLDMMTFIGKEICCSFYRDHTRYPVWDNLRKQNESHDKS
jgi:hypothetical protein